MDINFFYKTFKYSTLKLNGTPGLTEGFSAYKKEAHPKKMSFLLCCEDLSINYNAKH